MKLNKYTVLQLILCCMVFSGCDKYLDITPKGKTLLTTVANYDQWLNDPSLTTGTAPSYLNLLADNYDFVTVPNPPVLTGELIYTWNLQFSLNVNDAPVLWGEHYAKINSFNTVLLGIDQATGGTESQKRSLKAEALIGRALEYWYLLNEYGKEYDPATASADPAVPFVTSNDVTQNVPGRASVAEIYQHIIGDLTTAIPDLPLDNSGNRYRGSTASGYSLLARAYLYAGDYTNARKNAQLALSNTRAVMINLNGTLPVTNLLSVMPDVIYGRQILGNSTPTLDLMRSFASNDLRVTRLYRSSDSYKFTTRGATSFVPQLVTPVLASVNTATTVQEMKLIIAEAAARSNDLSVALQQLDDIRKNRIAAASYVAYSSAVQEEVLQQVLLERCHEMPFNGLRWFDMRRLDKENRMDAVRRYNAQGTVVATLSPHSDRYTLQIPIQVLSFNPGMQQNP